MVACHPVLNVSSPVLGLCHVDHEGTCGGDFFVCFDCCLYISLSSFSTFLCSLPDVLTLVVAVFREDDTCGIPLGTWCLVTALRLLAAIWIAWEQYKYADAEAWPGHTKLAHFLKYPLDTFSLIWYVCWLLGNHSDRSTHGAMKRQVCFRQCLAAWS